MLYSWDVKNNLRNHQKPYQKTYLSLAIDHPDMKELLNKLPSEGDFVNTQQERWPRMRSTQKVGPYETHVYSYDLKTINDSAPPLVFSSKRELKRTVET